MGQDSASSVSRVALRAGDQSGAIGSGQGVTASVADGRNSYLLGTHQHWRTLTLAGRVVIVTVVMVSHVSLLVLLAVPGRRLQWLSYVASSVWH